MFKYGRKIYNAQIEESLYLLNHILVIISSIKNLIDWVTGAILIFLGYKVSFRNVSLARLFKDYKKLVGSYVILWGARIYVAVIIPYFPVFFLSPLPSRYLPSVIGIILFGILGTVLVILGYKVGFEKSPVIKSSRVS